MIQPKASYGKSDLPRFLPISIIGKRDSVENVHAIGLNTHQLRPADREVDFGAAK